MSYSEAASLKSLVLPRRRIVPFLARIGRRRIVLRRIYGLYERMCVWTWTYDHRTTSLILYSPFQKFIENGRKFYTIPREFVTRIVRLTTYIASLYFYHVMIKENTGVNG